MNAVFSVCAVATLVALVRSAPDSPPPSEPMGVFAVLDKVVLKPDAEHPTEVELHGAFAVAEGARGNYYRAPRRGVLRFGAGKNPDEARKQWRELQKHAGTGTVVTLSSRYEQQPQGAPPPVVQDPAAAAGPLAPYGTGIGVHVIEGVDFGPPRELKLMPRCASVEGATAQQGHANWPAVDVTFVCENCAAKDKDLAYVFEVTTSDGDRCASGLVAPGAGKTTWRTELALQADERITWSVRVVGANVARTPCDEQTIVVKGPADASANR